MAAASFGYQPGDGSGAAFGVNVATFYTTSYTNTTGSTVYVDNIELLYVDTVGPGVVAQLGLYSDEGLGYPVNRIGRTDNFTPVAGANMVPILGDPVAVGPGVTIHAGLATSGLLTCANVRGVTGRARRYPFATGSTFPDQIVANIGPIDLIMPLVMHGDTVGPGDPTDLLTPLVVADSLGEGDGDVEIDLMATAVLGEGVPEVQIDFMTAASVIEGYSAVEVDFMSVAVLMPVVEGGEMATDELLFSAGVSWEASKRPTFNTSLEEAANLRDVSAALAEFPRWEFEVSFPFLRDDAPDARFLTTALKYCEGFFCKMRGKHGTWLFRDPDDNQVVGGPMLRTTDSALGGDGVTTDFWFTRDIGGQFYEPVGQVDLVPGYRIDVNGVAVAAADYTFVAPNRISFDAAPADGATVAATFGYFFVCRFMEDAADFRRFAGKLWEWQQVGFRSVLQ